VSRTPYNPLRGTRWLPRDIDLHEIDWSPLPATKAEVIGTRGEGERETAKDGRDAEGRRDAGLQLDGRRS